MGVGCLQLVTHMVGSVSLASRRKKTLLNLSGVGMLVALLLQPSTPMKHTFSLQVVMIDVSCNGVLLKMSVP